MRSGCRPRSGPRGGSASGARAAGASRFLDRSQGATPAGELVLGLGELGGRLGIGDDAAAHVDAQLGGGERAHPDGDGQVELARPEVAEGAAVRAAPRLLPEVLTPGLVLDAIAEASR